MAVGGTSFVVVGVWFVVVIGLGQCAQLYGLMPEQPNLYQISPVTGAVSAVGPIGPLAFGQGSITADPEQNLVYAVGANDTNSIIYLVAYETATANRELYMPLPYGGATTAIQWDSTRGEINAFGPRKDNNTYYQFKRVDTTSKKTEDVGPSMNHVWFNINSVSAYDPEYDMFWVAILDYNDIPWIKGFSAANGAVIFNMKDNYGVISLDYDSGNHQIYALALKDGGVQIITFDSKTGMPKLAFSTDWLDALSEVTSIDSKSRTLTGLFMKDSTQGWMLVTINIDTFEEPGPNPDPVELWYTQIFDHFETDDRMFQQRFLVYADYYRAGGPMFFTAGGESDVYGGYHHNGFQFEVASRVGAFILYVEHRFYGESLPFSMEETYTWDNIKRLSIEQAMADNVAVIQYVKTLYGLPANMPIIAWGGSYAGELVTYMRVAYPDIIHASVAGSAPVRYHTFGDVKNGDYFAVTTRDFGHKNQNCPNLVRSAFNEIIAKDSTPDGRQWITEQLRLCSPLEEGEDALRLVALWIENAYAQLAMLDYPWPNSGAVLPAWPIDVSCDVMLGTGSLTYLLGQSIGVLYNNTLDLKCFNITEEYAYCADLTGCGGGTGDPNAMSWDYQSCTELISNVDTNNVTDMFPPYPYDYEELCEYCAETWGATPDPLGLSTRFDWSNSTRIIFSNGLIDPWWPGGVLQTSVALEQYSIIIPQAAHHLDFYGSDPVNDPVSVVKARQQEEGILNEWIAEINAELNQ
ncbi:dipeptidyl-peptidase family protein [Pelomyxa schiedti]|nr:dipeptidyl-peptidase family protein [Pelomyxa schiedti]